ncbi:hypothetical protein AH332_21655 [Salmonella enterica subsp. salamae]|nr:hypothetical protein [Salmonella enterica subsp. salamae]
MTGNAFSDIHQAFPPDELLICHRNPLARTGKFCKCHLRLMLRRCITGHVDLLTNKMACELLFLSRDGVQSTSSGSLYYSYERLLTCAKKRKDGIS